MNMKRSLKNVSGTKSDPVSITLLPDSAEISSSGRLFLADNDILEIADIYGTPLFVYDEDHIRSRCKEAVSTFGPNVAYASKAFFCKEMAKIAFEEGMKIDVSTAGELAVAVAAGVPGEKIVFHGNNKSSRELVEGVAYKVGRIVVDSFDEIEKLRKIVTTHKNDEVVSVLIRVTPGVEAHTHEFVKTGQEDSKFGFSLYGGEAEKAYGLIKEINGLDILGVHMHIGSQIFDLDGFEAAIENIAEFVKMHNCKELVVGGGLGVPYVNGETSHSISNWGKKLKQFAKKNGIRSEISTEPGRSIVAQAGITIYRIGTIKRIEGIRTYVAVDGGMSDNPRPVLYGSGYEAFLPRETDAERPMNARIVGKHCESGDILVDEASLPQDTVVGDFVITPVTGAYGYSMASNYNKVPRPAVVFVKDGDHRLVIRRETTDDLLRLDV